MLKLLIIVGFLLFASIASAQTMSVNINRAKLSWNWLPDGASGPLEKFIMKCGPSSGNYNRLTDIGPTLREIAVKDVIGGSGAYFCAIVSANVFGESLASNEVPFVAGVAPSGTIVLTVGN